jgi:myo-inositol 2-dehydrogenase/D-chiro-inositol 1-dehydrogenase
MARVRLRALLATGKMQISGIAARRLNTAQTMGAEFGCDACFDDYRRLSETRPDALLVEVPHEAQDPVVLWALAQRLHILIGGTLATTSIMAAQIGTLAAQTGRVVEAGYEARYSPAWEYAKQLLESGELGRLVTVRSIALWNGDPRTWYYSQRISGGMPLTHMTYCFINPVRWIAGDPLIVSAFASRVLNTAPELIDQENVVANMKFGNEVLCNMTAGFIAPGGLPAWSATFIGTKGAVVVCPDEVGAGTVEVYHDGKAEKHNFTGTANAFKHMHLWWRLKARGLCAIARRQLPVMCPLLRRL